MVPENDWTKSAALVQHQLGELASTTNSMRKDLSDVQTATAVLSTQLSSLRRVITIAVTVFVAPIVVAAVIVALRLG